MRILIRCFMIVAVGLVVFRAGSVSADYQSARAEYQREYSEYRELLVKYEVARSEYLTYKTIVSRSQAILTTKEMLQSRNQVIRLFLEMLRERWVLAKNEFLPEADYSGIEAQILSLQDALEKTQPRIDNAEEIDDLVAASGASDTVYKQAETLAYLMQGHIILSRARSSIADAADVLSVANEQIDRIGNEGVKDTTDVERGLIDAEARLSLAQSNHAGAEDYLRRVRDANTLATLRNSLRKSRQYIKSMNDKLLEITRLVKIQD